MLIYALLYVLYIFWVQCKIDYIRYKKKYGYLVHLFYFTQIKICLKCIILLLITQIVYMRNVIILVIKSLKAHNEMKERFYVIVVFFFDIFKYGNIK